MKKSLLAIAIAAAVPAVASAQVTISGAINYGLQDTGVDGVKLIGTSLGGSQNAINIVASEKIGKDLEAGVRYQLRYSSVTGDSGGLGDNVNTRMFHDANVFIIGGFGEIRGGKIFEDSNCGFDPWGCMTTGGSSLAAGFSGSVGTLTAAQTVASSIYYKTPSLAGFTASYQTGVTMRNTERQVLNLSYAAGPFAAQALFTKGGMGSTVTMGSLGGSASPTTGAAATANCPSDRVGDCDEDATSLGLSYDFKVVKVMAVRAEVENAAGVKIRKATQIGAIAPLGGNVQLLGGYVKDDAAASDRDTRWVIGANYLLSNRTMLGADLFEQKGPTTGTGFALRARHTF
jgi:hypothetical protein